MGRSLLPSVSAHEAQHFAVSHPSRLPPCQLESWRHLPVASDEIPWRRAPALGGSHGRCRAGTEKGNASALAETAREAGITKTALILVGQAVAHRHYNRSELYHPAFTTGFREAKQ